MNKLKAKVLEVRYNPYNFQILEFRNGLILVPQITKNSAPVFYADRQKLNRAHHQNLYIDDTGEVQLWNTQELKQNYRDYCEECEGYLGSIEEKECDRLVKELTETVRVTFNLVAYSTITVNLTQKQLEILNSYADGVHEILDRVHKEHYESWDNCSPSWEFDENQTHVLEE